VTVATEIKKLSDRLRTAKAANPSPLRRMIAPTVDEPVTRTRKRKPTLAGVARQAVKAGIEVARYEVRPDGTVAVVTGKPTIDITDTTTTTDPTWN
jgi:hypothetical protein